jgi:hypothetical protein
MKNLTLFLLLTTLLLASSCVVERTQVGTIEPGLLNQKTYKKGKDIYLFWNQLPLQKTERGLDIKNYEIIVKRNLFDVVVTYGTAGIFSFYTVIIKTERTKEVTHLKNKD